jgi:hypothetical protein
MGMNQVKLLILQRERKAALSLGLQWRLTDGVYQSNRHVPTLFHQLCF